MVGLFVCGLSFFLGADAKAQSGKVEVLTPSRVAELLLKQGFESQEIELDFRAKKYSLVENLSYYDWTFTAESSLENDRFQTFSPNTLVDSKYERMRNSLSMLKTFSTGTELTISMNRLSQRADINPILNPTASVPASQTQDIYGVSLEQNLWGEFFGSSQRTKVESSEVSYSADSLKRLHDLQEKVLEALKLFWEVFVAKENYKESLSVRDRYQKLADSVVRKSKLGYGSPGEVPQILAELETRQQRVQISSLEFVNKNDELMLKLKLPKDQALDFQVNMEVPEPPELAPLDVKSLRPYREQALRVDARKVDELGAEKKSAVNLSLLLSAQSSGNDPNSGVSSSEAFSGVYPRYNTGLKLEWKFGSGVLREELASKRVGRMKEEVRLEKLEKSLTDELHFLQLKVKSSHNLALSQKRTRELRSSVVQELNRSYSQGRTELKSLIDALNALSTAEIQWIRAVGDYQIALNEYSAFSDQLVRERELQ